MWNYFHCYLRIIYFNIVFYFIEPITMAEANAVGDNVATLNVERISMEGDHSAGRTMRTGDIQPTSRMSVEQILQHETQLLDITIDSTTSVGAILYATEIAPLSLQSDVTTRVEWMSRLYRFWKGAILFRFIFTKTILQQFKIMAVFVPGGRVTDTPPTPQQAYYYTHKAIFNPANETEATIEVPFVSTRAFHEMSESTGMFYVMVYQPLVVSFQTSTTDSTAMYIKMFVAGKSLEYHEFVPLPDISGEAEVTMGNKWLWTISENNPAISWTVGGSGTYASFISDSGAVMNCTMYGACTFTGAQTFNVGRPVALADAGVTVTYNRSSCRTLWGVPNGSGVSRQVVICTSAVTASTDAGKCIMFAIGVNADGCWMQVNVTNGDSSVTFPSISSFADDLSLLFTFSKSVEEMFEEMMVARGFISRAEITLRREIDEDEDQCGYTIRGRAHAGDDEGLIEGVENLGLDEEEGAVGGECEHQCGMDSVDMVLLNSYHKDYAVMADHFTDLLEPNSAILFHQDQFGTGIDEWNSSYPFYVYPISDLMDVIKFTGGEDIQWSVGVYEIEHQVWKLAVQLQFVDKYNEYRQWNREVDLNQKPFSAVISATLQMMEIWLREERNEDKCGARYGVFTDILYWCKRDATKGPIDWLSQHAKR